MNYWTNKGKRMAPVTTLPIRSARNTESIKMLRIALITNHPPPFRIPIYHKVARMQGIDLRVIFCTPREPNRQWELPPMQFNHVFLKEKFVTRGSNFIHNNPDVITKLKAIEPD